MNVVESMTRIDLVHPYLIRVWRAEEAILEAYSNEDLYAALREIPWDATDQRQLAETLRVMPRVNAVEVTHKYSGHGVVVYNDWP